MWILGCIKQTVPLGFINTRLRNRSLIHCIKDVCTKNLLVDDGKYLLADDERNSNQGGGGFSTRGEIENFKGGILILHPEIPKQHRLNIKSMQNTVFYHVALCNWFVSYA